MSASAAPPASIVVIDGPADAGVQSAEDVCLPLGPPWDPGVGQMSRSLQPCTVTVIDDLGLRPLDTVVVAVGVPPVPHVLPATGSGSVPLVLLAFTVLFLGVSARLAGRCKVTRRPPRCVQSPGDVQRRGALVEATASEGTVSAGRFSPVREVSCTPSRAREVVKGSPSRPGLLFTTGSSVPSPWFEAVAAAFCAAWDDDDGEAWVDLRDRRSQRSAT